MVYSAAGKNLHNVSSAGVAFSMHFQKLKEWFGPSSLSVFDLVYSVLAISLASHSLRGKTSLT